MGYHDPRKMADADLTAALMTAARIESDDLYLFADEVDYRLRTRGEALERICEEIPVSNEVNPSGKQLRHSHDWMAEIAQRALSLTPARKRMG
jgi:hypothetical protein